MKKILFYISLVIGLALLFLFGKGSNINILAINSFDNNIGTIPFRLDIDNYNTDNLLDFDLIQKTRTYHNENTYDYNNYSINQVGTGTFAYAVYTFYNVTEIGKTYNISFKGSISELPITAIYNTVGFGITPDSPNDRTYGQFNMSLEETLYNVTFTANSTDFCIVIYISTSYDATGISIDISNLMLVEGEQPKQFGSYFRFGYNVSGRINMLCPSANAPGITFNGYINDNLLFNKYFQNGDYCGSFNIDNMYIPFNIDNNGYISFNSLLRFEVTDTYEFYNYQSTSYLTFTPVYQAYYKGNDTNGYLYSKLSYTSNNFYMNSFKYLYTGNSTGNYITFNGDVNTWGYNLSLYNNITTNVTSDYTMNVGLTNKFNFNDFLGYSFNVGLFNKSSSDNSNLSDWQNNNIIISIGSINSRVINNSSTTTPLPGNQATSDKYNVCSAWYDIPCQLGNAITYVIYEAPIISPIINFFDGLIEPIKQFIKLIDLFSGFGILFALGITAMLICIIKKMYGGSDG